MGQKTSTDPSLLAGRAAVPVGLQGWARPAALGRREERLGDLQVVVLWAAVKEVDVLGHQRDRQADLLADRPAERRVAAHPRRILSRRLRHRALNLIFTLVLGATNSWMNFETDLPLALLAIS